MQLGHAAVECHEAVYAFREVNEAEYAGLKESIQRIGLQKPIILYDDKLIDGRARLRACEELGIDPWFEDAPDDVDPVAYVEAMNWHRRHLSKQELAKAADDARQKRGLSFAQAAAEHGVSPRLVQQRAKVSKEGTPELNQAVDSGAIPVAIASRLASKPPDEQRAKVQRIQQGGIASVRAEVKPQRRPASDARPTKVTPQEPQQSPEDSIVDSFARLEDGRINTVMRLMESLGETERQIVAERFGFVLPKPEPESPRDSEPDLLFAQRSIDNDQCTCADDRGDMATERELLTDELIHSPEMMALKSALKCSKAEAIGFVRLMFWFTAHYAPGGNIGKHQDGAIADACDWKGNAEWFVATLADTGWLDRDKEHRMIVNQWPARCPASVRVRLAQTGQVFVLPTGLPDKIKKISNKKSGAAAGRFVPPSVEEVAEYCTERKNAIDPEQFVDHYTANGWKQSSGRPIQDWKAAVRTWEKNGIRRKEPEKPARESKPMPVIAGYAKAALKGPVPLRKRLEQERMQQQ